MESIDLASLIQAVSVLEGGDVTSWRDTWQQTKAVLDDIIAGQEASLARLQAFVDRMDETYAYPGGQP